MMPRLRPGTAIIDALDEGGEEVWFLGLKR